MTDIPIDVLIYYGMAFEGETIEDAHAHYMDDHHFYETFLIQTDHVTNKIVESLIETMCDATALDFVLRFIAWLVKTNNEYHDVIGYRKFARSKISKEEN